MFISNVNKLLTPFTVQLLFNIYGKQRISLSTNCQLFLKPLNSITYVCPFVLLFSYLHYLVFETYLPYIFNYGQIISTCHSRHAFIIKYLNLLDIVAYFTPNLNFGTANRVNNDDTLPYTLSYVDIYDYTTGSDRLYLHSAFDYVQHDVSLTIFPTSNLNISDEFTFYTTLYARSVDYLEFGSVFQENAPPNLIAQDDGNLYIQYGCGNFLLVGLLPLSINLT